MPDTSEAVSSARPRLKSFQTKLGGQRLAPVTVVLDALDEAQHPPTLLTEVLAQLNPPTTPAGCG